MARLGAGRVQSPRPVESLQRMGSAVHPRSRRPLQPMGSPLSITSVPPQPMGLTQPMRAVYGSPATRTAHGVAAMPQRNGSPLPMGRRSPGGRCNARGRCNTWGRGNPWDRRWDQRGAAKGRQRCSRACDRTWRPRSRAHGVRAAWAARPHPEDPRGRYGHAHAPARRAAQTKKRKLRCTMSGLPRSRLMPRSARARDADADVTGPQARGGSSP